jgi:hypothetical protein
MFLESGVIWLGYNLLHRDTKERIINQISSKAYLDRIKSFLFFSSLVQRRTSFINYLFRAKTKISSKPKAIFTAP